VKFVELCSHYFCTILYMNYWFFWVQTIYNGTHVSKNTCIRTKHASCTSGNQGQWFKGDKLKHRYQSKWLWAAQLVKWVVSKQWKLRYYQTNFLICRSLFTFFPHGTQSTYMKKRGEKWRHSLLAMLRNSAKYNWQRKHKETWHSKSLSKTQGKHHFLFNHQN